MPDFWEGQVENRGKCGKWSFSQGLSNDFSRLSLTLKNTPFYTFSIQIKKAVFLDKFQTVPSFFTLSLFRAKFQILLCPPIRSLSKLD